MKLTKEPVGKKVRGEDWREDYWVMDNEAHWPEYHHTPVIIYERVIKHEGKLFAILIRVVSGVPEIVKFQDVSKHPGY